VSHETIAQRVAGKASLAELAAARALGYDGVDAYISAWRTLDAVYALAWAPDRPAVNLPGRMVRGAAPSSHQNQTEAG
jgi:hypothetical protein